jgi:hypothetical protein
MKQFSSNPQEHDESWYQYQDKTEMVASDMNVGGKASPDSPPHNDVVPTLGTIPYGDQHTCRSKRVWLEIPDVTRDVSTSVSKKTNRARCHFLGLSPQSPGIGSGVVAY